MAEGISITLNQRVISFIIGIITLMSLLTGFVTIFNSYTFRVEQLEIDVVKLDSRATTLSLKIDNMSQKYFDLTLDVTKLQEREKGRDIRQ